MRRIILALAFSAFAAPAFAADPTPAATAGAIDWNFARAYLAHRSPAETAALVALLDQGDAEVARQAAKLVRVIGIAAPDAFRALLQQPTLSEVAYHRIMEDLAQMPTGSAARGKLAAIAADVTPVAAARR
ncbi:MAG: hypothetical protein U1F43_03990 [Myxococcota bacterium]